MPVSARLILAALAVCVPRVAHAAIDSDGGVPSRVATLVGSAFPGWKDVPSASDMAHSAPTQAMRQGISGTTILFCSVNAQGRLVDCVVDREEAPGNGFGKAALSLVGKFRMRTTKPDGTTVSGETVKFPVRFISPN